MKKISQERGAEVHKFQSEYRHAILYPKPKARDIA